MRKLMIIAVVVGLAAAATAAWIWNTNPARTANRFQSVFQKGKISEASEMLVEGDEMLLDPRRSMWQAPPVIIAAELFLSSDGHAKSYGRGFVPDHSVDDFGSTQITFSERSFEDVLWGRCDFRIVWPNGLEIPFAVERGKVIAVGASAFVVDGVWQVDNPNPFYR